MNLLRARAIATLSAVLCLVGCGDFVLNPISPQEARHRVIEVSRQVIADLGAEAASAKFGYDSCNDYGKTPFRGHSQLKLWMPGADRTREVAADSVLERLRQHGWHTDPNFHSHAVTFKRDSQDVEVRVTPPPNAGRTPVAHVLVDVYGECRDNFDHRSDGTAYGMVDIADELTSG